jgi:hypothetical protein
MGSTVDAGEPPDGGREEVVFYWAGAEVGRIGIGRRVVEAAFA